MLADGQVVKQASAWTMMFTGDVVIRRESRKQVKEQLVEVEGGTGEGVRLRKSKTKYMFGESEGRQQNDRMRGVEVAEMDELAVNCSKC